MLIEMQTGPQLNADSSTPVKARGGRLGDLIFSPLHAWYYEQTSRQNVFSALLAATTGTVAAGNINAAAAAASTQFAIWNPVGSGVLMAILKVFIGAISGTPPAGPPFHSILQGVPNASIATKGVNNYFGGNNSKGLVLASAAGAALTGSPNPLITLRPMAMSFFAAALAAGANIQTAQEILDGDIVLAPGYGWVPTWSGAGTTFLNAYGVTWEEVPP